jgi:hypothetical protein
MTLRSVLFTAIATLALAMPALADDVRVATAPERMQLEGALTKEGYSMINDVRVDNDKFKAYAKSKDAKNVEVTVDMKSLKVLNVMEVKAKP